MNSRFDSSSSRFTRFVSVLAAFVMTAALFSAVAIGLTGEDSGMLLAQAETASAVQA